MYAPTQLFYLLPSRAGIAVVLFFSITVIYVAADFRYTLPNPFDGDCCDVASGACAGALASDRLLDADATRRCQLVLHALPPLCCPSFALQPPTCAVTQPRKQAPLLHLLRLADTTNPQGFCLTGTNKAGFSSIFVMPASLFTATVFSEAMWQRAWASADKR
jgi:hypothetical protein